MASCHSIPKQTRNTSFNGGFSIGLQPYLPYNAASLRDCPKETLHKEKGKMQTRNSCKFCNKYVVCGANVWATLLTYNNESCFMCLHFGFGQEGSGRAGHESNIRYGLFSSVCTAFMLPHRDWYVYSVPISLLPANKVIRGKKFKADGRSVLIFKQSCILMGFNKDSGNKVIAISFVLRWYKWMWYPTQYKVLKTSKP